ncbi:MAG: CapA family protein [Firmicutes bacterium]|nr:CapA family protein [Bacillota bacterium]
MKEENTKRIAYWDNLKGILILLVVFAHILFGLQDISPVYNTTVDIIYTFHMSAFVFVSGYFGKSKNSHSFESIVKLLFLYFIFNSVMGFMYGFKSMLHPMYSFWYLLALALWRATAHRIAGFKSINIILLALALFIGFYPDIDNTFALARIIGFYPFYMSGYMLNREKSEKLINKKYIKRVFIGLCFALTFGVVSYVAVKFFCYSDEALQMGAYQDPTDAFGRIVLFALSFLAIYALRYITPGKNIPVLGMFGRNSLSVFIFHRPVTLFISEHIKTMGIGEVFALSVFLTFIICLLFGNNFVAKYFNIFADMGKKIFTEKEKGFNIAKFTTLAVAFYFVFSVIIKTYNEVNVEEEEKSVVSENTSEDIIYPVMNTDEQKAFDEAFRLTFAGDLILLEDQVKRGYNGKDYDFSDMFSAAKPHIASADYAIGVFEGPMAGEEAGYSTSNFDDGKSLYLNFPDSFAYYVKDAGFDLVTTANNHLLDKGEKGALRTIDVLDKTDLDHTGSYKSAEDKEKNHIKLVEVQGIKMAVLSYTYGSNYIDTGVLTKGKYSYITSVISGTEGEEFEVLKQSVENDFKQAKALNPDFIVVLPHIGTQFSNSTDKEQEVWFNIFKENGADIILGDHPHAVEPAYIENYNDKNIFVGYCPGNFANIYRDKQGDTSMLTDVYIDRNTKKIIGGSFVPLYTYAPADGNYRAVPIYDIECDDVLRSSLTTDDIDKALEAKDRVTKVIFKNPVKDKAQRYYFNEKGYLRQKTTGLSLSPNMKEGKLYTLMESSQSICFIGDSVTEGTKNGGCPWYEPIEDFFSDKDITNFSKGGCTISYMVHRTDEIPTADLYVIALGTNDVRYRDELSCAMTKESFIKETDTLKTKLSQKNPKARFIFIAPWYSTDADPYSKLTFKEKTALNQEYCEALKNYCQKENITFINANDYIKETLTLYPQKTYLLDHIHPNSSEGVKLYSEAVLLG